MTRPPIIAALLNPSLAHLVFSVGYDKTSSSALSTLSEAFVHYLAHLAQRAVAAAAVAGRSRPTAKDVAVAIDQIGKGWPGGGMKDLLEWFEEERGTRANDDAALFDALGLPVDEWITGFVTGGRAKIPNDDQEYSYVQATTSKEEEEGDKSDVDIDMNMDLDLDTVEMVDTQCESYNTKSPQRRRPEHIPDHLPPFPGELSNSESRSGENGAKYATPNKPKLDPTTEADKDAPIRSETEVISSKSSKTHATGESDGQHCSLNNHENAPSDTNGPISSNNHLFRRTASQSLTKTEKPHNVLETYTQIIPFTKSRLKEHIMAVSANLNDGCAQVHATDLLGRAKDDALVSRRSSTTSSAPSASSSATSSDTRRYPKIAHKDRPIRAIQELEKVLAALPPATSSNGTHSSGGLEAAIQFENVLGADRPTDTLFGNADIPLLDRVVRNCSRHIVKLVTPTQVPIKPATNTVVGTSEPLSAATSGTIQQRNNSNASSTVIFGNSSCSTPSQHPFSGIPAGLPLDRFDQSHHSISATVASANLASSSLHSSTTAGASGIPPYVSHISSTGTNITISHVPSSNNGSHGKMSSTQAISLSSNLPTANNGPPSTGPVTLSSTISSSSSNATIPSFAPSAHTSSLPPSTVSGTPAPTIRLRLNMSTDCVSATPPSAQRLSAQPPRASPMPSKDMVLAGPMEARSHNLQPGGGVVGLTETAAGEEVRCLCLGVDDGTFMIACDRCQVWYHGRCVGIQEVDAVEMWYCKRCKEREIQE